MGFRLPDGSVVGDDTDADPTVPQVRLPGGGVLEQPSYTERVLGGTLLGLSRNPVTGFFVDRVLEQIPDLEPKPYLAEMESRLHGSRLSDVFEVAGEWGPDLAAGIGAYAVGRAAARTALTVAARRGLVGRGLGQALTAYAADAAGAASPALKPGLLRVAELLGGNAAVGAYTTGRELAAGSELEDALQTGAITGGLGLGFEGALAGVGRLTRYGRRAQPEAIRKAVHERGRWLRGKEAEQKVLIGQMSARLGQSQAVLAQEQALLRALSVPTAGVPAGAIQAAVTHQARRVGALETLVSRRARRLRGARSQLDIMRTIRRTPVNYMDYTRDQPFNPNGKLAQLRALLRSAAVPPEDEIGRQGIVMTEALKDLVNAELEIVPNSAAASMKGADLYRRAADVLGIRVAGRLWLRGAKDRHSQPLIRALNKSPLFKEMFDLWETQGDAAVAAWLRAQGRGHKVAAAKALFDEVRGVRALFDRLVALGGEEALTPQAMQRMGVVNFLPHVMEYRSDAELIDSLGRTMFAGRKDLAATYLATSRRGLRHFGSIDHQRRVAGSLASKVARGMPFVADPIEGLERYMTALGRRLAYGKRFGINGELRELVGELAAREGADPRMVTQLLDQFFNIKYVDAATQAAILKLRNMETAAKMPLAVIPNFSQPVNAALATGVANTLRSSLVAMGPQAGRRAFLRSYGMGETLFNLVENSFVEGRPRGGPVDRFLESLARGVLRYSGFERVEDLNRTITAVAAGRRLKKDLARALAGRLRGNNLDRARRTFRMAGLNLDDAVRRYRALAKTYPVVELWGDGPNALYRASQVTKDQFITRMGEWDQGIWRMVQHAQFTPSLARRPEWWNTPTGRVMFQFKNFSLNQYRFLRDAVFAEAAHGNMRPAAVFLSLYPLVGEGVRDAQAALKGQSPGDRADNLVDRYLDNMLGVGGFAIAGDALMAARWGRLANWLIGPAPTDAVMLAEALVQRDMDQLRRQARATPAYRAGRALMYGGAGLAVGTKYTLDQVLDWVDQEEGEGDLTGGETMPTLAEFGYQHRGTP